MFKLNSKGAQDSPSSVTQSLSKIEILILGAKGEKIIKVPENI